MGRLACVLFLGERFTVSRAGTILLDFSCADHPAARHRGVPAGGARRAVASLGYAASNIGTKKLIPVQSTLAILF